MILKIEMELNPSKRSKVRSINSRKGDKERKGEEEDAKDALLR